MAADTRQNPERKAGRRRRLTLRIGAGIVGALVVLSLLAFVAPTPLARWIITSQLESLGVQHEGISTVDIDLWNSRVRAGPVRFHSGEARPGRIGRVGFDYSFGAVFKGQAFLQNFFLSGIDLYVKRGNDGALSINGVSLQQAKEAEPEPPADRETESSGLGIGLGVERFRFTDSVLAFEDVTGGTLSMDIKALTVERLFTWTPEKPARFVLEGALNDIGVSLDGEVIPFRDPLQIELNSRLRGITLDRVTRFLGPAGLARKDGTVDTEAHSNFKVFRNGRIEGTVNGVHRFAGFAIATPDNETVNLEGAELRFDLKQQRQPDGSASLRGKVSLGASSIAVASALGDTASIGSLNLALDDFVLNKSTERVHPLFAAETRRAANGEASDRARGLIALMVDWVRLLALDALKHQLSFAGKSKLTLKDARLQTAARDGGSVQTARFGELQFDVGHVESQTFDDGFRAKLNLRTILTELGAADQASGASAEISGLELASNAVDLSFSKDRTSIALDMGADLKALKASDGREATVALNAFSLKSDSFNVQRTGEASEAKGPFHIGLEGIEAKRSASDGDLSLRGERATLTLDPLSLSESGTGKTLTAALAGDLRLDKVTLRRDGDAPLSLSVANERSRFSDVRIAPLTGEAVIEGALTTEISDVEVEAGTGARLFSLAVRRIANAATRIRVSGPTGGAPTASLANRLEIEGIRAGFDVGENKRADATVNRVGVTLSGIEAAGGAVTAKGDVTTPGIAVKEIAVDALNATLALSGAGGVKAEAAEKPAADPPPAQPEAPAQDGGKGKVLIPKPERPIRLGAFHVSPGSRIDIQDKSSSPPFNARIVLEALKVGPIDSEINARTNLTLAARINDASPVRLDGWISPFGENPALETKGGVEGLNLTFLSPLVAKAVGVNLESGDLNVSVGASTKKEGLAGRIDVRVDDLFVVPISDKEAERLKASVGLPVGFAVGILKDKSGRIELAFPLSGPVAAPEVDFSDAINKALSGALASLFPMNWFGEDANSFSMQPAKFLPGATKLAEEGRDVADRMGKLISTKADIRVRACGRAGRDDLIALRVRQAKSARVAAAPATAARKPAPTGPGRETSGTAATPPPASQKVQAPDPREVKALLALATERGQVIREYLARNFGIAPDRVAECRTSYSIDDGKPPRAEFQF